MMVVMKLGNVPWAWRIWRDRSAVTFRCEYFQSKHRKCELNAFFVIPWFILLLATVLQFILNSYLVKAEVL